MTQPTETPTPPVDRTPADRTAEIRARQRSRSIIMAFGLLAFVILMYFITIARMSV